MVAKTPPKIIYPDRQAEHEQALARLQHAARLPGLLKVITADHACAGGPQPRGVEQIAACVAHPLSLRHPHHHVLHDAVRIEERPKGRVRAWTREGDFTEGYPADVLRRLLEHMTEA